MQDKLIGWNS